MSKQKLFISFFCALLVIGTSETASAKPATTLKIIETSDFIPPSGNPWFVKADVSNDVGFQGARGIGGSVGYKFRSFFFDLSMNYFSTTYGAIHVYQPGIGYTPEYEEADDSATSFKKNSEIARKRGDGEGGNIFTVGPGIGAIYKFFKSDKWTQIGRFGLNYANFHDNENDLELRGLLMNFHFGAGYQLGPVTLSPGVTWNLGYVRRTGGKTAGEIDANSYPHYTYLPIQWFSFQLGAYFWL